MEFLGGLLLGPVAQELLNLILETKGRVHHFKDHLGQLQSTLQTIIPTIEEGDRLNAQLTDQRPRTHIEKLKIELEKGKELMWNCLNIPFWNVFNKSRYSQQIVELNRNLRDCFDMGVLADTWLLSQQIFADLREGRNFSLRPEVSCSAPVPDKTFGMDLPLMELKKLLFGEDVRVLGLCGPPGCGKTTLAAMLCRDKDVEDSFENIFFLRVSSTPNLKGIVERLFQQMMMNRTPTFLDDEDAVMQLGNLLEREPNTTLLVLDDVWDDSLVQKFVFKIEKYKILVTSRTKCPTFDDIYSLKMLTEPDAMALFRHSALFPQNGNGNYEEPDWDLLNKIVDGCKGLPLVLSVIGHSLRRQPPRVWQSTERKLSSCSIFESHSVLLHILGTSIDNLEKKVQECFMDLSSFPEDQRIPASALIDIWVELHGIDEVDAYINLHELSTKNLVSLIEISRDAGEIDGNMNKLFVTQHDLLRDLAIYRSRQQSTRLIMERTEDSLLKRKREQEFNARLVSIHTGEKFLSNWCNMHLPEAEVLILDFFATNYNLPPFMEEMEKLKVLIIVNHGHYYTQLNCLTIPSYLSHLKRVRLEKVLVPSLTEIAMPLKNLKKISLFMCQFGQALSSEIDFPYMFPNLVEIDIDYCNDLVELPQGICNLVHLQSLSITNCHELSELPERIGNMRDLTVLRLHACTKLSELPDSLRELQVLSFLDISDCINVELPEWISDLRSLRKLNMGGSSELSELPCSAVSLVNLRNVICDEGTANLWNRLKCHLPELNITVRKDDNNLFWLGDLKSKQLCS
ncbi:putative disease resistance protein At5g47280 [Macadamia integrifolia]|uniref:putative disease resistance protein At5g47280 n=1 Tax=Macadamia integrifolia TaxID=60698 RepID=UPI001C4EB47F|nr:putative disease resistance protein At5g47280 [Macadamia integrifolia]